MAFTLPDDLAPELYPLAWLVGTWRGYGILTYGQTVPEQAVYQEMVFDHDGGPYLRQVTTVWTVDATRSQDLDFETPGLEGASRLAPAQIWSTETTYWRPVAQEEADAEGSGPAGPGGSASPDSSGATADLDRPGGPGPGGSGAPRLDDPGSVGPGGSGASTPRTPLTRLELVSADPAGHVAVWEGWIRGPRAQVATQAVGRTRTAVPVTQMSRMLGLVGGDLMWTQDMAAFGVEELSTYASGRLGRVEDPDDPASQPGSALEGRGGAGGVTGQDDAAPAAAGAAAGTVPGQGSAALSEQGAGQREGAGPREGGGQGSGTQRGNDLRGGIS